MTLDPKKRDGLKASDAKFLEIVDKFDWHVMSVFPRLGEKGQCFSYSTGLFLRFQHPEILLCGLASKDAAGIINLIGRQVQGGKTFGIEQPYSKILADNFKCAFRPVQIATYSEYVCFSQWFYEGDNFPVLQCFWPDDQGLFPWEEGCEAEVANAQPQLFLPTQGVM